jgi:hypothetical protein
MATGSFGVPQDDRQEKGSYKMSLCKTQRMN